MTMKANHIPKKFGSQEGDPRQIADSIVQLATTDEVPLRLILRVNAEKVIVERTIAAIGTNQARSATSYGIGKLILQTESRRTDAFSRYLKIRRKDHGDN
jgi:hypothetical protein